MNVTMFQEYLLNKMIKLIKKLFKSEEPEAIHEKVDIAKLTSWFDEKIKFLVEEEQKKLDLAHSELNEIKKTAKQNIKNLEDAKLRNPNIPEKAKHYMQGNRIAYIKRTSKFFEKIELPKKIEDFLSFEKEFYSEIDDLGKATIRSFRILAEFFEHESSEISKNIKQVENIVKKISESLKENGFELIEITRETIRKLQKLVLVNKETKKQLDELEKKLAQLKEKREAHKKQLDELIKSKEYKNFEDLKKEKSEIEEKIKLLGQKIFHDFSSIDSALKKYSKIALENNALIESYLENPVKALIDDRDIKIFEVLEKLKASIEKESVELKDQKKQKILASLSEISKERLSDYIKKHNEYEEKLGSVKNSIFLSEAKKKQESLKEELEKVDLEEDRAKKKIKIIKDEVDPLGIEKAKKVIIANVEALLEIELEIN